jgi:hypothetical protein
MHNLSNIVSVFVYSEIYVSVMLFPILRVVRWADWYTILAQLEETQHISDMHSLYSSLLLPVVIK